MENRVKIGQNEYPVRYSMRVLQRILDATGCANLEQLGERIENAHPDTLLTIIVEGVAAGGEKVTIDDVDRGIETVEDIQVALDPWRQWFAGFFTGPSMAAQTAQQ